VPEGIGWKLILLFVLIICSAILTGAEAAYFSLGRARLRHVAAKDDAEPEGAPKTLIERPHELLVTLLVGITVINIGAAAIATMIADSIFGPTVGVFVEIVVLVFVLTTFGEVLPMTLAVTYPERFLAVAGRPVAWLGVILAPARAALAGLTALMVRIVSRGRMEQAMLSEEELRTLVDVGASEGVVEREEREMIHKVFELEDTQVRSVMVPRTDMVCLDVETPTAEILPALREHLHSRVPVYEGSIDVIVGILYAKDLLPFMEGLPPDFDLRAHLHPPYFVPESKRADALLQEFQAKRVKMAIFVEE
jgi:putative hemolysin